MLCCASDFDISSWLRSKYRGNKKIDWTSLHQSELSNNRKFKAEENYRLKTLSLFFKFKEFIAQIFRRNKNLIFHTKYLLDKDPHEKHQNDTGHRCFKHLKIVNNNLLMFHGYDVYCDINHKFKNELNVVIYLKKIKYAQLYVFRNVCVQRKRSLNIMMRLKWIVYCRNQAPRQNWMWLCRNTYIRCM